MAFRIVVSGLLVLTAGVLAQASHARGIQVDGTMTCASVVKETGSLSVPLKNTGNSGNTAKADVNFPVLACYDSLGAPDDTSLTVLPYDAKNSVLYTWIDLAAAGGTPSSLCLVPPLAAGCSQLTELASFDTGGSNPIPIIAMVDVLKLTKSHSGDYEILVNYESFPASTCDNIFKPITPTFSWFGKTYTFNASKNTPNPCESPATNDFLFGPNGVLLGHNYAPDGSPAIVLTKGLPPGWSVN